MFHSRYRVFRPAILATGLLLTLNGCTTSKDSTSDPIVSDVADNAPANDFEQAYQEAAMEEANRAEDPMPNNDSGSTFETPPAEEGLATNIEDTQENLATESQANPSQIPTAEEVPDYTITDVQASNAPLPPGDETKAIEPVPAQTQESSLESLAENPNLPSVDSGTPVAMDEPVPMSDMVGEEAEYIVQPGDNLASIAKKLYGSRSLYRELAAANNIKKPTRVHPGDIIKFKLDDRSRKFAEVYRGKGLKSVKVKKGDTLSGIAKRTLGKAAYWKTIWKLNRDIVENPNKLKVGMTLKYFNPAKLSQALKDAGLGVAGSH